jgi:hypothetical protein
MLSITTKSQFEGNNKYNNNNLRFIKIKKISKIRYNFLPCKFPYVARIYNGISLLILATQKTEWWDKTRFKKLPRTYSIVYSADGVVAQSKMFLYYMIVKLCFYVVNIGTSSTHTHPIKDC